MSAEAQPQPFSMRYLDLEDLGFGSLTMAGDEAKWKALAKLDINRPDDPDTTPLQAWVDAMLFENGITPETPRKPLIHYGVDLGFSSHEIRMWIWFLS